MKRVAEKKKQGAKTVAQLLSKPVSPIKEMSNTFENGPSEEPRGEIPQTPKGNLEGNIEAQARNIEVAKENLPEPIKNETPKENPELPSSPAKTLEESIPRQTQQNENICNPRSNIFEDIKRAETQIIERAKKNQTHHIYEKSEELVDVKRCGTEPPKKRQKVENNSEISSKELCYLIMLYMDHNVSKIKIKG